MSHNEKSLFWICVILTMGMALTALMISLPRTVDSENPISLDYQGAIVTIFFNSCYNTCGMANI